MSIPIIQIKAVSKAFKLPAGGIFHAVKSVSLDIDQGDIFGLIGKSGAGKSTLLRLINLLERPDSGEIIIAGHELTRLSKTQLRLARQNIGMIFQQFNLLQNATVFDNVAFPLKIHAHYSKQEITQRVTECLEIVGLASKADSYPAQLSGGQKQRVAIARALASKPNVVLCDEPTSALDAETTREVLDTLRDINQRLGVSIVIVSHELSVLSTICNKVAVLEDGEIAESFSLADTGVLRKTALGRELAFHGKEAGNPEQWKELSHV
jgi:D-methionine transport system ATP-binding protein